MLRNPGTCLGTLLLAAAGSSVHAVEPASAACGRAYLKMEATFAREALGLTHMLCKSPASMDGAAAEVVQKANHRIATFNSQFGAAKCDPDLSRPVASKKASDVRHVLESQLQSVPLDRFCNGQVDPLRVGSTLCGNGVTDPGEACDTGGPSATCDYDCTAAACGDGLVNTAVGEQCDDGNTDNADACTNRCFQAVCGDSITQTHGGEECDDGNQVNGDGCSSNCKSDRPQP